MIWKFGELALTAEEIDFLDPAAPEGPDVRERGLRIEFRVVDEQHEGSVYASDRWVLQPAFCRLDLLESAPGRADRIHWHPAVTDGEPGQRVFDPALTEDPLTWIHERLRDLPAFLQQIGKEQAFHIDLEALRSELPSITAWLKQALDHARRPWPTVTRNERGLAVKR
ncbi:hypothetical protein [Streptomyces sp. ODS28]|uniref:hypothetical protein n=1 Tax=Streptomyces sp. ODS28 TaxID=3136688 RepID=UPI0031F06A57